MSHDAQGRGRTFSVGDPGYDDARRNSCFNRNLADRMPDLIVQANDAAEVAAVIERHGAELVLHGHNHRVSHAMIGNARVDGIASASALRCACFLT